MPNRLMAMAARSIASSSLADPCVVVTEEGAFPTRATEVSREEEDANGAISLETVIRIPLADIQGTPVSGDVVDFDGRARWVIKSQAYVSTMEIWLTDREPRNARKR